MPKNTAIVYWLIPAKSERELFRQLIRILAKGGRIEGAKVEQAMTKDVISIRPEDDVSKASELMKDRKVSRVLICDASGKPVGVISLGDLAERHEEGEVGKTVKEVKEGASLTH